MNWLQKLFGRNNSQKSQQLPNEPNRQAFTATAVLQAISEETILAGAYWLINVVKHSLEPKPTPEVNSPETPVAKTMNAMEDLVPKVISLIEKIEQPSQAIQSLDSRLSHIEQFLHKGSPENHSIEDYVQVITSLENRVFELESFREHLEITREKLGENRQDITSIENRIAAMENLPMMVDALTEKVSELTENQPNLENQLAVESLSRNVNLLTAQISEFSQKITVMESRIVYLEKVLPRILSGWK